MEGSRLTRRPFEERVRLRNEQDGAGRLAVDGDEGAIFGVVAQHGEGGLRGGHAGLAGGGVGCDWARDAGERTPEGQGGEEGDEDEEHLAGGA